MPRSNKKKRSKRKKDAKRNSSMQLFFRKEMSAQLAAQLEVQKNSHGEPTVFFTSKLTGAFALLFAEGCEYFLRFTTIGKIPPLTVLPVWCGLSPQQRIKLVKDVMLSLLCENEPLENIQTEQHFLAYVAIREHIAENLLEEVLQMKHEADMFPELKKVFHIMFYKSHQNDHLEYLNAAVESAKDDTEDEQRLVKAIRSKIASRQKKILEVKVEHGVMAKNQDSNQAGTQERKKISLFYHASLFEGVAPPRVTFTPDPKINPFFYYFFRWRLLCDNAFQEHRKPGLFCILPLRYRTFNWGSCNYFKFGFGLRTLFFCSGVVDDAVVASRIYSFHAGCLTEESYINRENHQRVIKVKRKTKEWRDSFDDNFDDLQLHLDARCIHSVCTGDKSGVFSNRGCSEPTSTFQERLDDHRRFVETSGTDSVHFNEHCTTFCAPKDFDSDHFLDHVGQQYHRCHSADCQSSRNKKLSKCAGCKVVKYCSRKCQVNDWECHKKDCKRLGDMMKEKEKYAASKK